MLMEGKLVQLLEQWMDWRTGQQLAEQMGQRLVPSSALALETGSMM